MACWFHSNRRVLREVEYDFEGYKLSKWVESPYRYCTKCFRTQKEVWIGDHEGATRYWKEVSPSEQQIIRATFPHSYDDMRGAYKC